MKSFKSQYRVTLFCCLLLTMIAEGNLQGQPAKNIKRGSLECAPVTGAIPGKPIQGGSLRPEYFLLRGSERFAAMWGLVGEVQDTSDFFARTREITIPITQETRNVIEFLPNPDQYLWKMTLSLAPSQFFIPPSELDSVYGAILKNRSLFDASSDPLSLENNEVAYFTRTRGRDRVGRFLSGFSLSFSLSERPKLDGGSPLPPPVFGEDERIETYGAKFDPLPLFVTGSELSSAFSALSSYAKAYQRKDLVGNLGHLCRGFYDESCINRLSGFSGGKRWAAALLPVLEFKSVDQFDFINVGGRYIFTPFIDDAIETFTVTWDLKRAFSVRKERIAALSAIQSIQGLSALGPSITVVKSSIPLAVDDPVFLRFGVSDGIKDVSWSVSSNCAGASEAIAFGGVSLEKDGLLVGYPEDVPDCRFRVTVTDAVGRSAHALCAVTPD